MSAEMPTRLLESFLGEGIYRDPTSDSWVTESGVRFTSDEIALMRSSPEDFARIIRDKARERDARTMSKSPQQIDLQRFRRQLADIEQSTRDWATMQREAEKRLKTPTKQRASLRDQLDEELKRREADEAARRVEWYESQRIVAPPGSEMRGVLDELTRIRRQHEELRMDFMRLGDQVVAMRSLLTDIAIRLEKGVVLAGGGAKAGKQRKYSTD